jgi:hypothetical protein
MEAELHAFLSSALDGSECSVSSPNRITSKDEDIVEANRGVKYGLMCLS